MDVQASHSQRSIETIKRTLKDWERTFGKERGRKPTSSDVDEAPASIKECYKEYRRLKDLTGRTPENFGSAVATGCPEWTAAEVLPRFGVSSEPPPLAVVQPVSAHSWVHRMKAKLLTQGGGKETGGSVKRTDRPVLQERPGHVASQASVDVGAVTVDVGAVTVDVGAVTADGIVETEAIPSTLSPSVKLAKGQPSQQQQHRDQNAYADEPRVWTQYRARRSTVPQGWLASVGNLPEALRSAGGFADRLETGSPPSDEGGGCGKTFAAPACPGGASALGQHVSSATATASGIAQLPAAEGAVPTGSLAVQRCSTSTASGKSTKAVRCVEAACDTSTRNEAPAGPKPDGDKMPRKRKPDAEVRAADGPCKKRDAAQLAEHSVAPRSRKAAVKGNYVKLNMKVKKYARGRQKLKGARLKRAMWKKKRFGGGTGRRRGTACFACGKEGHWSSACPDRDSSCAVTRCNGDADADPSRDTDGAEVAGGCKAPRDAARLDGNEHLATNQWCARAAADGIDSVQALYELGADGSLPATPPEVLAALEPFGHEGFRYGQEEVVMRVLCGLSTLVTLSTGGGKSLCYQLPAHLYRKARSDCTAIVVSPLVSLMEDQIHGLPAAGIAGECLHSQQSSAQQEKVWKRYLDGQLDFMLISPEFAISRLLSAPLASLPPVSFVCIDEAHCLSEWSHNFRPSYLRVCKALRDALHVKCFLGLTATASWTAVQSIAQHLGLADPVRDTVRGRILASNLNLSVSLDDDKEEAVLNLLQGSRFRSCNSIIIYCTRREQTERLAMLIRARAAGGSDGSWGTTTNVTDYRSGGGSGEAECYHAGLSASQRKKVQREFMSGALRIIVATVAFGMGLDKPDVRGIIHLNMPSSFERYVQEIGRAGRDGLPAECHLLLDSSEWGGDMAELKKHTYGNTVDRSTVRRLLEKALPQRCTCQLAPATDRALPSAAEPGTDDGVSFSTTMTEPSEVYHYGAATSPAAAAAAAAAADATLRRAAACRRHERALPIEATTMELDMKEETVSTLLCYLELHPRAWVVNMNPAYATCTVQSYGGADAMATAAQKCVALGLAVAHARASGGGSSCRLTFPVVDLSASFGRPSAEVKRELKQLSWQVATVTGGYRKTGILVEFQDLAFHFMAVGGLTQEEFDEVLDFLHGRVLAQEKKELAQLKEFYYAAKCVAHKNYWSCADRHDSAKSQRLRDAVEAYFTRQHPHADDGGSTPREVVAAVAVQGGSCEDEGVDGGPAMAADPHCGMPGPANEELARREICTFIDIYGAEHSLTARAIARILQGIGTPQFPAETWGRVRRFWRSRLDTDFNALRLIAASEMLARR